MPWQQEINRFKVAIEGIGFLWKEPHFKFHIFFGTVTIILGFVCNINAAEWRSILLCIALVLCAEAVNTVFEKILDFVHPAHHPTVGRLKDMAAAMVLIAVVIAIVIGVLIFWKYIF